MSFFTGLLEATLTALATIGGTLVLTLAIACVHDAYKAIRTPKN